MARPCSPLPYAHAHGIDALKRKALFLDRDGVINVDKGYVHRPADFELMPGILELLEYAKMQDFLLLLVTNQSGIARGYYSEQDFLTLSAYMQTLLQTNLGFGLDQIYYCPHAPEARCACRKPQLGMLKQALGDFRLDLSQSVMIGDKYSDMEFGLKGEIGTNLWLTDHKSCTPQERLFSIEQLQRALSFLQPKIAT